jgi:hypothetical protein
VGAGVNSKRNISQKQQLQQLLATPQAAAVQIRYNVQSRLAAMQCELLVNSISSTSTSSRIMFSLL